MIKIKDHLIKTIKAQRANEEKEKAIEKKKTAVEAYGNGTTGYRIKNGPNKGKVIGHISAKANNNFYFKRINKNGSYSLRFYSIKFF